MTGFLVPFNDEHTHFIGYLPDTVFPTFQPPHIFDQVALDDSGGLDFEPSMPVEGFELDGLITESFFDDWYNRLHAVPQRIDLSNVVSDQTRQILIWNAYLEPKTITEANYPTGGGIEVTDPVGVPYELAPLEDVYYTLSVDAEGPPTIDVVLSWTIGGEEITVPVTGRRIVVWPFPPNWKQPVVESLDWLTDIFVAFAGDEQRRQLRSKPRRMFEYSLWVRKADAAIMRNLLWGWQNRTYALPIWADRTLLQSAVISGATAISVDTSTRGFFSGGLLILLLDAMTYEVVEIDTVSSGSITLAKPMESAWPENTHVYPVNFCRMPMNVAAQRLTDGVEAASVVFNADPLQTDPNIPVIAASTTHAGYEVMLRKPNWAQPVGLDNAFDYEPIDFGTGGVLTDPRREFPQIVRRFQWVLSDRDEMNSFRGLLGRLKGRFKAAYLPTWFDDFELYEPVVASASTIPVKDNEFFEMVASDPALNTLMILVHGQAPIIRTINSVGTDPEGFTTLGLNAAIGHDLNETTLQRLSLVHLCRFASDRVTINWLSDSVATVEANFALVKA